MLPARKPKPKSESQTKNRAGVRPCAGVKRQRTTERSRNPTEARRATKAEIRHRRTPGLARERRVVGTGGASAADKKGPLPDEPREGGGCSLPITSCSVTALRIELLQPPILSLSSFSGTGPSHWSHKFKMGLVESAGSKIKRFAA